MNGSTVKLETPEVFEIPSCLTWGVEKSKFKNSGYNVPLVIEDPEIVQKLTNLTNKHKTKKVMKGSAGNTLYLSVPGLTERQQTELLGVGRLYVSIMFECGSVYEKHETGEKYLNFKVKRLRYESKYVPEGIAED